MPEMHWLDQTCNPPFFSQNWWSCTLCTPSFCLKQRLWMGKANGVHKVRLYRVQIKFFACVSCTQCARSLILREKWGVTSLIKSMHFWHLGTISSHSRAKIVSFDLLFIYYGGYQTEKSTFLLLKWLTLKKYHCATLCRDAIYIGSL